MTPPKVAAADAARDPASGPAPPPTSEFVGADELIDRAVLEFATPKDARVYDDLETCFVRYGPDWTAYPRRRFGNFVNVEWCRGEGSTINCAGGNTRTTPGAGWTSLEVLHYDRQWPKVFGLSFTTGQIPPHEGVAASVSWAQGGQSVLGDHMIVTFRSVQDGAIVAKVSVGMESSFNVGEDPVTVKTPGTPAELYLRLHASPESLQAAVITQIDGLTTAVHAALEADTPRKCIFGEYEGGGIPPRCVERVPLDASEKDLARRRLKELAGAQRKFVTRQAKQMHAALVELLPLTCWRPST